MEVEVTRDNCGNTIVQHGSNRYFIPPARQSSQPLYALVDSDGDVVGYVGKYRDSYAPVDVDSTSAWGYDPSMFEFYVAFGSAIEALLGEEVV